VFKEEEDPNTSLKAKKKVHKKERDSEEVIVPSKGSRSRPRKTDMVKEESTTAIDELKTPDTFASSSAPIINPEPVKRKNKIVYPSKRYPDREGFLKNWKDTFSKQWDVCCSWSF